MINIAIDGTTSSGKSTLAVELAKRLNFKRLDTGAIYRGVTCAFMRKGLKKVSPRNIAILVKDLNVQVKFIKSVQHVYVNGFDETPNLRTEHVSLLTSEIAPYKIVRDKVLDIQRNFAKKHNCVMEGRDITTTVLPNADVKFYITATPEERAHRRFLQFEGKEGTPSYEEVLKDLKLRDERDENRQHGKLQVAKDAIVVDTTGKNIDDVATFCESEIRKKIKLLEK